MDAEPAAAPLVTAAQIARMAGVTRATVSNWRKRHDDFPTPTGGTDSSPAYDLTGVTAWLARYGRLPETDPIDQLTTALRFTGPDAAVNVLPLALAASRATAGELDRLLTLDGDEFDQDCRGLAGEAADEFAGDGPDWQTDPGTAELCRAVIACVRTGDVEVLLTALDSRRLDSTARGQYTTPPQLASVMADLATVGLVGPHSSGFDPACGSGTLLGALRERGVGRLSGQDLLAAQTAMTTTRLAINAGNSTASVRTATGDSLRKDGFAQLRADVVVCNPPYADVDWGHEELAYDERWIYGVPAARDSELAWLQHCLAHLRPGGRAVLLLPPAVAGRASGRRIRSELVRRGAVRAIIGLPAGTAPPAHISLQLWVVEQHSPGAAGSGDVLFVDTSRDEHGDAVRLKEPEQWAALHETVVGTWRAFKDRPGIARIVPAVELLDDLVDLTPGRRIPAATLDQTPDELADAFRASLDSLRAAQAVLSGLAGTDEWPAARAEARTWRTATVGDLVKSGGPLDLRRGNHGSTESPPVVGIPLIQEGDILLPEQIRGGSGRVRVVGPAQAGTEPGPGLVILRPDPTRLDPYFLAGFLGAPENMRRAVTGTTTIRLDVRRLHVPLLPLDEQRRYGEMFRRIEELSDAARLVGDWADRTADQLTWGLTSGALQPGAGARQATPNQLRQLSKGN